MLEQNFTNDVGSNFVPSLTDIEYDDTSGVGFAEFPLLLKTLSDGSVCLVNSEEEQGGTSNFTNINNIIPVGEQFNIENIAEIAADCIPEPQPEKQEQDALSASKPPRPQKNVLFKCTKCEKDFSKFSLYKSHMLWHTSVKKYKCEVCSSAYSAEINLKVHMTVHAEGHPVCSICNLQFQRAASLRSHLMLHQVEEVYTCEECQAVFEKEEELCRHIASHEMTPSKDTDELICDYCKLEFEDTKKFKEHVNSHVQIARIVNSGKRSRKVRHNKIYPHLCDVCQKTFSKLSLLERHMRVHNGERPFVCTFCNKGFNQKSTLQIHLNKHKGIKPHQCTLCGARFTQKGNLRAHVEKTHTASQPGIKTHKCSQCPCIFKKIASLNMHMTKYHSASVEENTIRTVINQLKELQKQTGNYTGDEIDFTKETMETDVQNVRYVKIADSCGGKKYWVKLRRVNDVRWYVCSDCSKEFKKPSDLVRHIRIHTKERPFLCNQCDSTFALKTSLNSHLKSHLRSQIKALQPTYKCIKCQKRFSSLEKAQEHRKVRCKKSLPLKAPLVRTINGYVSTDTLKRRINLTKLFQCEICKATFNKGGNYKRHRLTHSENKEIYKCDHCERTFATIFALKRHVLTYTGTKNYSCRICRQKFATVSLLNEHFSIHNTSTPYYCPYCFENFTGLLLCKKHISTHRKEVEEVLASIDEQEHKSVIISVAGLEPKKDDRKNFQVPVNTNEDIKVETIFIGYDGLQLNNDGDVHSSVFTKSDDLLLNGFSDTDVFINNPLHDELNTGIYNKNQIFQQQDVGNQENILNDEIRMDKIKNGASILKSNNKDNNYISLNENILIPVFNTDLNLPVMNQNVNITLTIPENTANIDRASDAVSNFDVDTSFLCISCNESFSLDGFKNHICIVNRANNVNSLESSNTNDSNTMGNTNNLENDEQNRISESDANTINKEDLKEKLRKRREEKRKRAEKKIGISKKSYFCELCKRMFARKKTYMKHLVMHKTNVDGSGSAHQCTYCKKAFKKFSDLTRHLRTHTGEKPFVCNECLKKFTLKSTLKSHMRTHNPFSSKDFNCNVCNSFFSTKSSLKVHLNVHTGVKPHKCGYCEVSFRTAAHKRSHENSFHLNPKKKAQGQNRTLKRTGLVTIHHVDMATSNVNNDASADIIENDTQPLSIELVVQPNEVSYPALPAINVLNENTNNLNESIQMDPIILELQSPGDLLLSEQFLTSEIIGLDYKTIFNVKPELQSAILMNNQVKSKEKPRNFECELCHNKYASKDVLRKHKKIHGVYRKFPCSKCDKGFDTEKALREHDLTHNGGRPYSCIYCANTFEKRKNLLVHLKRIHNIANAQNILPLYEIQ